MALHSTFVRLTVFGRTHYGFRHRYRHVRHTSVAMGRVVFVDALAACFNVRIRAANNRATYFRGFVRRRHVLFRAIQRLINIPTRLHVTAINISEARRTGHGNNNCFVVREIAYRHHIIDFGIRFGLFFRAGLFRRTVSHHNVMVVLVFDQFLQFQFSGRHTLRTSFVFVLGRRLRGTTRLFALLARINVWRHFMAFAAAPRSVIFATRFVNYFRHYGGLHYHPTRSFEV